MSGNARDREMGRAEKPLGDLGKGEETWKPPSGQQGLSNRPDDAGTDTDKNPSPLNAAEQHDDPEDAPLDDDDADINAAPEPKDQDEKGLGHSRNR